MINKKQTTALVAAAMACGGAVQAADVEVTHWWTSGGEAAAVKVFADSFNELGGDRWIDGAIAGSGGVARPIIASRITGGDPMGATQLNHGRQAEDFIEAGLMLELTDVARQEGWQKFVRPAGLYDSCDYNGKIYCVPVNIHSWQWMWISLPAFEKAGVPAPKDWHDFVAAAPALRKAGIVPLALGNQSWQYGGMFDVLLVGLGGIDTWKRINVDRDADFARGSKMREVWQAFGDARELSVGSNVSEWNEATNLVITHKAGAQIMGDWAQGEFSVAGYTAGDQYDCLPGLGINEVLSTGGDAFYFPATGDADLVRAQKKMASMMVSKPVQVGFNLAKGSLPIRGDVDLSEANLCMKKGLKILENLDNVIPSGDQLLTQDTLGQMGDLIAEFWEDTSITPAEAQERWADILASAE